VDVGAGVGAAFQDGSTWTGHLEAGLRLPRSVRLEARAERERYLWTVASADTLLPLERVELVLDRAGHPGLAGKVALGRETFPDGNAVTTAYAWLLAPILPGLRLGWAASWQDARESRWSPVVERYEPYFTPEEQAVQSALAEVLLPLGNGSLRLNGSYGVRATEGAPGVAPGQGRPAVAFTERAYTPWSAVARLDAPVADRLRVEAEVERRETSFYTLNRGSLGLVLRFGRTDGR
jgi:hypothetical protein